MRVLVSPDKFKSSLSAVEVCDAIERGILRANPKAKVVKLPLADGGEGTLDILGSNLKAKRIEVEVSDPLFRPIKAHYLLQDEKAYIEMATASGLPLLKTHEKSAMKTSSYGTGELIKDAVKRGAKKIFVMIGGSATNDGGCGMAEALGVKFYAENDKVLTAIRGRDLNRIHRVDKQSLRYLRDIQFVVLSDVRNPLTGLKGASAVFGKQKGATDLDIKKLDEGLINLSSVLKNSLENEPGAGAAGGLGYGLMSLVGAQLKSGIEQVFEFIDYDSHLKNTDLIITGEGKLDSQTLGGKVIAGVNQKAKTYKIPIGIICGFAENVELLKSQLAINSIYQVSKKASSFRDSMENASYYVEECANDLLQSFKK